MGYITNYYITLYALCHICNKINRNSIDPLIENFYKADALCGGDCLEKGIKTRLICASLKIPTPTNETNDKPN